MAAKQIVPNKHGNYYERRAYRELRKIELAKEKELKLAKAKTCQICGREIFAETGVIAHHGYHRPGWGIQTPSCEGARELPFEVSRSVLAAHIDQQEWALEALRAQHAKVAAETAPVNSSYAKPRTNDHYKAETVFVSFTRESFDEVIAKHPQYGRHRGVITFDTEKERALNNLSNQIASAKDYLKWQRNRFINWEPKG